MKPLIIIISAGIILILTNVSCKQNSKESNEAKNNVSLSLLADTITYDAVINNPNPDDLYTERFLKRLNKEKLIDAIFDAVYSGKLKAYAIFGNKEMSIDQVKALENVKGFSRSKIGKVQFTESWYLDENSLSISKKVIAMAFGYDHANEDGIVDSYKPLFRVYIK